MTIVSLHNASVEIPIEQFSNRSWRVDFIRGMVGSKIIKSDNKIKIKALSNIDLNITKNSYIGLEGHNGSGKSTLLRLIAGIYYPTSGAVKTTGKIATLFSLGQGINSELSGIENIIRLGIYNGLSLSESKSIVDDVLSFSELGTYANLPVKTYSNGMQARLAFGVSTAIKPNILLIDEIIGVGDERFQEKAKNRVKNIIDSVDILIIASHSKDIINKYCQSKITLERGCIVNEEII